MMNLWRKLFPVRVEVVHTPCAQMAYFEGSLVILYPSGNIYEIRRDGVDGMWVTCRQITISEPY